MDMLTGPALATAPRAPVVLSYGLGVDSTAILVRWLTDPASRDFDLSQLIVCTAMTGDEWPSTGALVERHVLPLLRARGVRYVQVARRGPSQRDGVALLSDSRHPRRLHLGGAYRLAEEMLAAGTVPQLAGRRLCSQHAKGWPLDTTIAKLTEGRRYRHVVGFEANEPRRADRDASYNSDVRVGEYPLRIWGWDRARCEQFLHDTFGVAWPKSACTYCPFALATVDGRARTLTRFVDDPAAAVEALLMEYVATAINPSQSLIKGRHLFDELGRIAGTHQVRDRFARTLAELEWALYDVRRAIAPRRDGQVNHTRSLRIRATGDRAAIEAALDRAAADAGVAVTVGAPGQPHDRHRRVWLRRRDLEPTTAEHYLAAAPATAEAKTGPAFARAWALATNGHADEPQQLDLLELTARARGVAA